MATFTLLEFNSVTPSGEPIWPADTETTANAFATPVRMASDTVYFHVIPDADCYVRVDEASSSASSAYPKAYANVGYSGFVRRGLRPYVDCVGV